MYIPLGRFFPGFFISSAIAATLVTPAYATKTRAAVSPSNQTSVLYAALAGTDKSASPVISTLIDNNNSNNIEKPTIGA